MRRQKRINPAAAARWLALVLAVALAATACGNDEEGADAPQPDEPRESTTTTTEAADTDTGADMPIEDASVFPLTVAHKFGETTVPVPPERVVSIGYSDQDDLLALGVVPIAVRDWYGDQMFAVWPWAQSALGDAEPEVLSAAELNFEQIAALNPDLIVGVSSGMTEDDYRLLSQIAPTLAQSGNYVDWGMPWQERTKLIGAALGFADEAAGLVDDVETSFAAARDAHPEFAGTSAAVAFWFDGQFGAYGSQDTRSRIMADLGFVIPPIYDEIAGDSFYASFSPEQISLLDVDALVWLAASDDDVAGIAASPLRAGLNAYQHGREVFVGKFVGGAFSFASPLSLNYLLSELVPDLAAAIDGDPATAVASAVAVGAAPSSTDGSDGTSDDEQAAMDAWAVVFDSTLEFSAKLDHLDEAASLEESNAAYATAGERMGGISLEPTAAEIDGDSATITYNVLFAGNTAYEDQIGMLERVDGTWVVSRETYCGFLASARTPCQ